LWKVSFEVERELDITLSSSASISSHTPVILYQKNFETNENQFPFESLAVRESAHSGRVEAEKK